MNKVFFTRLVMHYLPRTYIVKFFFAFGVLCLGIMLGREYGPEGVGVFALANSFVVGASILGRYGMDSVVLKYVGASYGEENVGKYLFWAIRRAIIYCFILSVIIFCTREFVDEFINVKEFSKILSLMIFSVPGVALCFLCSAFLKGVRRPVLASCIENGGISYATCGLLIILNYFHRELGILNSALAFLMASYLVALGGFLGCVLCADKKKEGVSLGGKLTAKDRKELESSCKVFFISGLAVLIQTVLTVVIAGFFLNEIDLGLYRASERASILISFILMVFNAVFPPRFAALYSKQKLEELDHLAQQGAFVGLMLSLPPAFFCIFFPEYVLSLFGEGFHEGSNLLRIIAFAQIFNVATGSVSYILNMTGHERVMRNILILTNAIGLVVFMMLVKFYGVLGAAYGYTFIIVLQNGVAVGYTWKYLGIMVVPVPKMNSFLRSTD